MLSTESDQKAFFKASVWIYQTILSRLSTSTIEFVTIFTIAGVVIVGLVNTLFERVN